MRELLLLVVVALLDPVQGQCGEPLEDAGLPGDAVITALLPLGVGPDCETIVPRGIRLETAVVGVVSALSRLQPENSVDIGLILVDTCSSPEIARKELVRAAVQLDCRRTYPLGVLVGEDLSEAVSSLARGLGQPLWVIPRPSPPTPEPHLGKGVAALLSEGSWLTADVLTAGVSGEKDGDDDDEDDDDSAFDGDASDALADEIVEAARLKAVCARRGLAADGFRWSGPSNRAMVLVGVEARLRRLLRDHVLPRENDLPQLILVPPDGVWLGTPLPKGALLVLPDVAATRSMTARMLGLNATDPDGDEDADVEAMAAVAGVDEFLAVGRVLVRAADILRAGVDAICGQAPDADDAQGSDDAEEAGNSTLLPSTASSEAAGGLCARIPGAVRLVDELSATTPQREDDDVLGLLGVRAEEATARVGAGATSSLYLKRSPGPGRTLLTVAHFRARAWTFTEPTTPLAVGGSGAGAGAGLADCPALLAGVGPEVTWAREAWVAAVLTVSALGSLCVAAVALFITARIAAGDVLEGSATLSMLLLLCVLLAYLGAVPYCLRAPGAGLTRGRGGGNGLLVCALRLLSAPLAHALLLAVMLARALMLAACDHDGGLLSHVSGALQGALCFFTVAVQVGLSIQLGLLLTPANCAALSGLRFLVLMSYDGVLLLLLAVCAPFICTSRRNYREGGFFAASTVALLLVWAGWVSAYAFGGRAWRDAAVAAGLAGAATCVLLGVFIPRTYLMAGAVVRDRLAAQLPALARDCSITDMGFRPVTNPALYDSVSIPGIRGGHLGGHLGVADPPRAHASANLYTGRPSTPLTPPASSPSPQDTYERYPPPSPLKITRF